MSQQNYDLKTPEFKFQPILWLIHNSSYNKIATFCFKVKQNSEEMALIYMRCKHVKMLGDSIYEYNSNVPTSSCQYVYCKCDGGLKMIHP